MKQLVMIVIKIVWQIIVSISVIALCTSGFLLWKSPDFVSELILKFLVTEEPVEQIKLKGIGVIGDSQSDEYRADDNRGSNYPTSTYNWVELLANKRNVDFGEWSYYEEPRRQGYEYNFARSGATAQSMIDQGQHTGVAEYVHNGAVNTVIIFVGANDYAPFLYDDAYAAIYSNQMSKAKMIEKRNQIVGNIETAIETIQDAGSAKIFVLTIPDWGDNTAVKIGFPLPHYRYRVTEEIRKTNNKILSLQETHSITVIDVQEFYKSLRTSGNSYQVTVGDVIIDPYITQNNPRSAFLRDGIHTGTVLNGLLANYILDRLNDHFYSPIPKMSDEEILSAAGIE